MVKAVRVLVVRVLVVVVVCSQRRTAARLPSGAVPSAMEMARVAAAKEGGGGEGSGDESGDGEGGEGAGGGVVVGVVVVVARSDARLHGSLRAPSHRRWSWQGVASACRAGGRGLTSRHVGRTVQKATRSTCTRLSTGCGTRD